METSLPTVLLAIAGVIAMIGYTALAIDGAHLHDLEESITGRHGTRR